MNVLPLSSDCSITMARQCGGKNLPVRKESQDMSASLLPDKSPAPSPRAQALSYSRSARQVMENRTEVVGAYLASQSWS